MIFIQKDFRPTYLCIKQHSITKLLYFCKTTKPYKKMLKYCGSGKPYWDNHLKVHGKEFVETIWYCLFYNRADIINFALMCSEQWNIVNAKDENGKKIWANLMVENGVDGGHGNGGATKGYKYGSQSEEHRKNLSIAKTGKKLPAQTSQTKDLRATSLLGKNKGRKLGPQSEERKLKTSIACKGHI